LSDLTYVRVEANWYYLCVFVDLYNREIIGHSSGPNKTATLVQRAFATFPYNLNSISLFHTDRGKEFDNNLIEQALEAFGIEKSLCEKDSPYDNAVSEATFKTIKTEFFNGAVFPNQQVLELALFDYVNWYNNIRIHGFLDLFNTKGV